MMEKHTPIRRMFACVTRRRMLLALVAGASVLALPASSAGASASRFVEKFTVSPDTMCGFTGTSYWVVNLLGNPVSGKPIGNGSGIVAGQTVQTFVADNGRGVKITYAAGATNIGPTVFYPDGSSSITVMADGLNVKTQALGGSLLEQSTGRLTYTFLFDANGDFVSLTIDSATGPENNVTGAPDCSVIGPYLAGS